MKINDLATRFRAVAKLQSIRDCPRTSAPTAEAADYAIDLALSPSRQVTKYLVDDALRDAKKILRRKQVSDAKRFVYLDAELPAGDEDDGISTLHDVIPSASASPSRALIEAELLRAYYQQFHPQELTGKVLQALALGEPLAATAASLGISLSYAKKLRAAVRAKLAASIHN